ncbi:dihydroneopterin aldolase [Helicobacter anatolicus]|uniref:dihydroneopterin aldolase n=1 Tax=Helicobacter anatolicus TaxID=2905874 RepID=UPI001E3E8B70|nr:dihydroneopterin aldolase [Helicobacter anatolicus]MCE3038695.1 dihydroneopterin aldolase [Helicobacter anatolicus]
MTFSILIEKLTFETIIGILDFERNQKQKVIIDGIFTYENQEFLDYVLLKDKIISLFCENQYFLIEDALQNIPQELKKDFPCLKSIELSIKKPDILKDCIIGMKTKIIF